MPFPIENVRRATAVATCAGFALSLAVLAGCAGPRIERSVLTPESGAARFESRSLKNPGLRQYLRENTGRDPDQWDFETLCWVGFYYQPSLEVARAQWETARAAQRTADQRPNPTLSLSPGYDFTHQPGVSPWMPSVGLDFLVPTSGKRHHQQEIASADADAARLGVATAAWQMRGELRRALTEAATASRRFDLLQAQAEAQRRVSALLEQRFSAGAIAASEVSAARTALLRAETMAGDAETQIGVGRAHVAAALGLPAAALEGIVLPLPPQFPVPSGDALATLRGKALRSRSDVLAALAKYQSADAALALEVARRMPDVHIGPGYQWDQGLNKWTLGISLELPIFHQNEGPIAEAVGRRAEAAAQFNVVQGQAVAAIDSAWAGLRGATGQLERVRRLQVEVKRQTTLVQRRRELGSADELELAAAQLDEAVSESAVVDAEAAVATAAGQLEDAVQVPFSNFAALTKSTPDGLKP